MVPRHLWLWLRENTARLRVRTYSDFIHAHQNLEATKVSFSKTVVHPFSRILFGDEKKRATKPQKDMEEA